MIPPEYIPKIENIESQMGIVVAANSLNIHPAIVAGRLHRERQNYRQFARLVGNHEVRKQFPEYSNM